MNVDGVFETCFADNLSDELKDELRGELNRVSSQLAKSETSRQESKEGILPIEEKSSRADGMVSTY